MGWSPAALTLVLLALVVAIIAATHRLRMAATARRDAQRARTFFVLGFVCGFMSFAVLRERRRWRKALTAARSTRAHVRPLAADLLCSSGRFALHMLTGAASRLPGAR